MTYISIKTKEEFETEVIKSQKPVVVDFWAPWCGPCKMFGPIFEEESNNNTHYKFVKVNVDEAPEIASEQQIRGIPTIKIFENGILKNETSGAMMGEAFKNFLEENK